MKISLIIFALFYTEQIEFTYYNHSKWQVDNNEYRMLYDKPTEITEISYNEMADSILKSRAKEVYNYKFNFYGDLIYKKASQQSDSFFTITTSTITKNGFQSVIVNHNKFKENDDTSITKSRMLSNGQFLQTNFWTNTVPFYYLKIFEDSGNIEKTIVINDTNNFKKIYWTEINYYKNDLIQKHELNEQNKNTSKTYFYSSRNFLDSILIMNNGDLSSKEIFINNEEGDVVKYFAIKNPVDTFLVSTFKYEYDKHNNWTKKWKETMDKRQFIPIHIFYSFYKREINYADQ